MARASTGIILGNFKAYYNPENADSPFTVSVLNLDGMCEEINAELDFEDLDTLIEWYENLPRPSNGCVTGG